MLPMKLEMTPTPDEDTAAAVIAAISCLIEQEQTDVLPRAHERTAWRAGAASAAQGLPPARNGAHAGWHAAERTRRASCWSYGIVGM
jgi:hypothetical protein